MGLAGPPALASVRLFPVGDVILKGDNEWWFLDTVEGTLTVEWPHWDAVERSWETEEGQDHYLLGGLAVGAASRGMVLPPGKVWAFIPHPVTGGDFNLERVIAVDIAVALSLTGQIHAQARGLG